jgi:hypothetical protein
MNSTILIPRPVYQQVFASQFLPVLDLSRMVAAANLTDQTDQYDAVTPFMVFLNAKYD